MDLEEKIRRLEEDRHNIDISSGNLTLLCQMVSDIYFAVKMTNSGLNCQNCAFYAFIFMIACFVFFHAQ